MIFRNTLQRAASAVFFFAVSGSALAQTPATPASDESSYLVWVVFAGAALIILATGFMNSKRSHLN